MFAIFRSTYTTDVVKGDEAVGFQASYTGVPGRL